MEQIRKMTSKIIIDWLFRSALSILERRVLRFSWKRFFKENISQTNLNVNIKLTNKPR